MQLKLGRVHSHDWVVAFADQLDQLRLDVRLHVPAALFLVGRELGPDLDAVEGLLAGHTLVKQPHPADFVALGKLPGDRLENQLLPHLLDDRDGRPEVSSELAALFVDGVLPLGQDAVFEETESVDALFVAVDGMEVDLLGFLVEEEVVDVTVLQVDPGLGEGDQVVEPSHLAHGRRVVPGVVVLPKAPLGLELQTGVQHVLKLFALICKLVCHSFN